MHWRWIILLSTMFTLWQLACQQANVCLERIFFIKLWLFFFELQFRKKACNVKIKLQASSIQHHWKWTFQFYLLLCAKVSTEYFCQVFLVPSMTFPYWFFELFLKNFFVNHLSMAISAKKLRNFGEQIFPQM